MHSLASCQTRRRRRTGFKGCASFLLQPFGKQQEKKPRKETLKRNLEKTTYQKRRRRRTDDPSAVQIIREHQAHLRPLRIVRADFATRVRGPATISGSGVVRSCCFDPRYCVDTSTRSDVGRRFEFVLRGNVAGLGPCVD